MFSVALKRLFKTSNTAKKRKKQAKTVIVGEKLQKPCLLFNCVHAHFGLVLTLLQEASYNQPEQTQLHLAKMLLLWRTDCKHHRVRILTAEKNNSNCGRN